MKVSKKEFTDLLVSHGKYIADYDIEKEIYSTSADSVKRYKANKGRPELLSELSTKQFVVAGYYFVLDSKTKDILALTAIGDQWGKYGFTDRINRIRRKATKQNELIHKHRNIEIVFVEIKDIKYFVDNSSVWGIFKKTLKTERNTILENARIIRKVYPFKY